MPWHLPMKERVVAFADIKRRWKAAEESKAQAYRAGGRIKGRRNEESVQSIAPGELVEDISSFVPPLETIIL